ncbi:hypothetical protein AB0A73_21535 [Glycomyces sp. NPDC047369]
MSEPPETAYIALNYSDADVAEDALARFAQEQARLRRLRDPIIAGAIAAGVSRERAFRLSRVARTTIDRISNRNLPTAVDDLAVLVIFTDLLDARAARYRSEILQDEAQPNELDLRARVASMAARRLRHGQGDWAGGISDDAALLSLIIDLDQARESEQRLGGPFDDLGRAVAAEQAQIRAEAAAFRARGAKAVDRFDPRDRDAAEAAAQQRADTFDAAALGITVEAYTAMTPQQRSDAFADLPDDTEDDR